MSLLRFRHAAAALAASCAFTCAAQAATIYQSATNSGEDNGEYAVSDYSITGGVFTLTGNTDITEIGAQFGAFSGGNIFGAILAIDPQTGLPIGSATDLASTALGGVVFSVASGTPHDQLAALSLTLTAGTYAVVFGSGQFGATGFSGLGYDNDPLDSPNLIRSFFSDPWANFGDTGVRVFVEGAPSPTPEPATWGLLLVGFGGIGGTLRARRRAILFA